MSNVLAFSYCSARSRAITWALGAVVVIESIPVHFAVATRHPGLAWALTVTSIAALVWLVLDYRALGSGLVRLHSDALHLRVGRRFDITIPMASVARSLRPTFRDVPTPGTNEGRDYVNLTKPAAPNVLVVLHAPRRVRLTAGLHRKVRRVALRLDDPEAFLEALEQRHVELSSGGKWTQLTRHD